VCLVFKEPLIPFHVHSVRFIKLETTSCSFSSKPLMHFIQFHRFVLRFVFQVVSQMDS